MITKIKLEQFLSCLCGSEQSIEFDLVAIAFLSCLCGSEHYCSESCIIADFLSCLCGSELIN